MATVTRLRDDRRGRVAVELDGAPWRVLPVDVVVRSGLVEGRALDRETLRLVRRELRRAEALVVAGRALRSRDLSRRRLAERLERTAPPAAVAESLATLERAGLVDDERVARSRAQGLAARGWGDEGIRHRLRAEAFGDDAIEAALHAVEPESDRAEALIQSRGPGRRTARYLASRGFGEEAVEAALGAAFGQEG